MTESTATAKILYLTHNYPRHRDDFAGRFVARLAEMVTARGHGVLVLAPHAPGCELAEDAGGVQIRRFRYASDADEVIAYRGEMGKIALSGAMGVAAYWRFVRAFTTAAQQAVSDFRPDVMHAHWWLPSGWVASRLKTGIPVVVTMHGTDLRMLERMPWIRPLAARVFDRAATITVVSQSLADVVTGLMPRVRGKIQVTPMPANDTAFYADAGPSEAGAVPIILCVTRFTAQKRNDVLLRALASLSAENLAFRARFIGEGPLRRSLESLGAELGLHDRIEFVPPMAQQELAAEYRRAAMVVLPAVDEGFGMVLVEAQLCGVAVLGARSGGIIDIIDHDRTGLLVEPDDAGSLADALKRLLRDADLRGRLAQAGREAAQRRFSSKAITDRFCGWYTASKEGAAR